MPIMWKLSGHWISPWAAWISTPCSATPWRRSTNYRKLVLGSVPISPAVLNPFWPNWKSPFAAVSTRQRPTAWCRVTAPKTVKHPVGASGDVTTAAVGVTTVEGDHGVTVPIVPEGDAVTVAAGSDCFFNSVPKFAPGAELPVLVGLSDLRRNAGGVYGARDAILSEGLTLTMRNPFLSPFVVLVPGDSWDAVARRRPAIHGPAGGMACWHPAMRRPPKTRRCAATGWWKRLPDARLRF